MKLKSLKPLLTITIIISLIGCNGQINNETPAPPKSITAIGKIFPELDDKIWAIYQDRKDNYWFGSNGNGLFFYNGKNIHLYTEEDGLMENTIRGIQEDHLGNLLIETPKGVCKFDGKTFTTLEIISDASNKWKLEPNDLWFNCNGNADDVYRYDGNKLFELKLPRKDLNQAFGTVVKGLSFPDMNESPYSVFGIDKDKNGNLWIGTIVAGAFRYDGESFLWVAEKELTTLPDGRVPGVRSMIEDKDGNIWLSNFLSKYKIIENTDQTTYEKLVAVDNSAGHFDDQLPYFNSGLTDNEGNLWMTTYGGGVWKYDGEQLIHFPVNEGDEEVLIVCIYQDNKGIIWLGTDNLSVYQFNGEVFEKFKI